MINKFEAEHRYLQLFLLTSSPVPFIRIPAERHQTNKKGIDFLFIYKIDTGTVHVHLGSVADPHIIATDPDPDLGSKRWSKKKIILGFNFLTLIFLNLFCIFICFNQFILHGSRCTDPH